MNLLCSRDHDTFTVRFDLYDPGSDSSVTQYLSVGWREVDELIGRLSQLRLDHAIDNGDWPDNNDRYRDEPF